MADKKEAQSNEQEERIPVFTVLKNNAILKNIFLLDNPPTFSDPRAVENCDPPVQEFEETLLVGRHPDCNITVEHPSISRFHLRIHSKPSCQKLSVIDLSSVHGTWVSGEKIEPGVRVDLNEGDTMRLGGSSRVYRLHWVPLSHAYDMDNPFVAAPLPVSMQVEENEDEEDETHKDEDFLFRKSDTQPLGDDSEVVNLLFSDANSKSLLSNTVPSASPLPECLNSTSSSYEEAENTKKGQEHKEFSCLWSEQLATGFVASSMSTAVLFETENQRLDIDDQTSVDMEVLLSEITIPKNKGEVEQNLNLLESFKSPTSTEQSENQCSLGEENDERKIPRFFYQPPEEESVNSSLCSRTFISRINDQLLDKENQTTEPLSELKFSLPEIFSSSVSEEDESRQADEVLQIVEKQEILLKDHRQREVPLLQSGPLRPASDESPSHGGNVISEIKSKQFDKANQSPPTPFASGGYQKEKSESPLLKSEQNSKLNSIWSRRGKPSSVLQLQTGRSRGKTKVDDTKFVELPHQEDIENNAVSKVLFTELDGDDETFTPDRENLTPNTPILKRVKKMGKVEEFKDSMSNKSLSSINKAILGALLTGSDGDEESFTPDKENFTPSTYLLKSTKKMSKMEDLNHSNLHRPFSLGNMADPSIHLEDNNLASSVKEKQPPKVLKEHILLRPSSWNQENWEPEAISVKKRAGRLPFQPILANSRGKSKSEASVNYGQITEKTNYVAGEKRRWNILVDTTCLLNKESRKTLQLLQGLKGTQLIIPGIVIRELGCIKSRVSLFRRKTEVSSALQWIEDCMVNTPWWIHVQSSEEEGRPVAPTPPISPQSQFSEENCRFPGGAASSVPFSVWEISLEIVSPTADDHILEYALLSKRIKNDGRLALLTNDVTLKIKALAEGLICETAEEFRESLVNPFSERFLWTDSSPRGPTWSCADDVVLREKYYSCPSRKPTKSGEGAKGLKLILLHNSHYAQTLAS